MSDGHATADGDLSTSETAVPSRAARTHAPAVAAKSDEARHSTRGPESTAEKTLVGRPADQDEGTRSSAVQAQTLIAPEGTEPEAGDDGYRFGATVVAASDAAPEDGDGFRYGATIVAGGDAAGATRIADPVSSFEDARTTDDLAIHPGESLIGRFRILKTLGEGSFGAVYLAEDPQLDRRVAIKVSKVGVLTTRSDVDRFQREAKAAAQLRHPNIVPVYEVGRIGRSSFLAYEYINGTTLGSRLKAEKKLRPRDAAQLMHAIAGALGYAHELGIIHRDMKPDNVLVDQHGQPHIADFGLARRDSGEMDKTREGGLMGTPLYMSPEQAAGRSHEADARTDVWSLGVMLREMLTGVLPFQGKLTEILIAVQHHEPPGIRTLDRTLPKDLETICQKCLSKDPALRYANGTELAEELDRFLRGEPILARPLSAPARLTRWVKRNPQGAAVISLLLLAAVISTWSVIAIRQQQRQLALDRMNSLTSVIPSNVPGKIEDLRADRGIIAEPLRQNLQSEDLQPAERNRLQLAMATLYPESAAAAVSFSDIANALVTLPADEVRMQVELLKPYQSEAIGPLLQIAHDTQRPLVERRLALYGLATLAQQSELSNADIANAAAGLLAVNPKDLGAILELVEPIRDQVGAELEQHFDENKSGNQAASVLADMFKDRPQKLYSLAQHAAPVQIRPLITSMQSHADDVLPLASRDLAGVAPGAAAEPDVLRVQRNAFIVQYALAAEFTHWDLLAGGADNTLRTEIIHALPQAVPQWELAVNQLTHESHPLVRQALLLILEKYPSTILMLPENQATLRPIALQLYQTDASPAVHSAAGRLLLRTGGITERKQARQTAVPLAEREGRNWFRNSIGQEFAVVTGPVDFQMGAQPDDPEQDERGFEQQHLRLIPRSFAIGMHEVTVDEFKQFKTDHPYHENISPDPQCPMTELTWYDAARFCRWLSEQEGVAEEEMCFPPEQQIGPGMSLPENVLERTGYRLPTAAEWEYACRAGSTTSRWIGSREQTDLCAWYVRNSDDQTHPVGLKEPNGLGLFDTLGNAFEHCQDWYFEQYPVVNSEEPVIDGTDHREGFIRELRGASYSNAIEGVRSSFRDYLEPEFTDYRVGFRLARTVRPE